MTFRLITFGRAKFCIYLNFVKFLFVNKDKYNEEPENVNLDGNIWTLQLATGAKIYFNERGSQQLKGFNRLFLSGQAGIVEASSIVESYKKIKTNMIDTRFEIYNIELEIGEIVGSFAKQDTL